MKHDLTDDEAATVEQQLQDAADYHGLPLTTVRRGLWVLRHGSAIPAWVMVWKTGKGRYRLHVLCSGWTYDRRFGPERQGLRTDGWNSALSWLCINISVAVAGVAVLGQEPPCEPST